MLFVRFLDDANSNVYLAVCHVVLLDNVFVLLVEFEDTVELLSGDRLIFINHQISKVDDCVTLAVNQQGQRICVILVQFGFQTLDTLSVFFSRCLLKCMMVQHHKKYSRDAL